MIYCEMLGHDCSFGYIKCIEVVGCGLDRLVALCQSQRVPEEGWIFGCFLLYWTRTRVPFHGH